MERWFISYWPYDCSHPASYVLESDNIEETINLIQMGTIDRKGNYEKKRKVGGIEGTVIFFYKLRSFSQ